MYERRPAKPRMPGIKNFPFLGPLGVMLSSNEARTHLALGKDAPLGRAVQRSGTIVAIPILSGLHHHYVRI
jgi:hypothetical protein